MPNKRRQKKRLLPSESEKAARSIRAALTRAALDAARADFQSTANPVHLLNGFATAVRARVPVPAWIIKSIAAATEQVLEQKGKLTLDTALGFKSKKGQRSKWSEQDQLERDARLKWLIEERPREIAKIPAKLRDDLDLRLTTSVSGLDGAAEQALELLQKEAEEARKHGKKETTYPDIDSLLQRYYKKIKHRPVRAPR